jgi:hypothetical protein
VTQDMTSDCPGCPFCGERNSVGAVVCRGCNEALPETETPAAGSSWPGGHRDGGGQPTPFDKAHLRALALLVGVSGVAAVAEWNSGAAAVSPLSPALALAVLGGAICLGIVSPRGHGLLGMGLGAASGLGSYLIALLYLSPRQTVYKGEMVLVGLVGALPGLAAYYLLVGNLPEKHRDKLGKAAVPGLIQSLHSAVPFVRYQAAVLLGRIGPEAKAAAPALLAALRDEYQDVREQAAKALKKIAPQALKEVSEQS